MADTPLGKMIIEMGFDDSSFAKGVTGVNKQLSALKNDLKTSQTSFSTFGKGVDGVRSPMEVLTKSIETQKRQLDLLKKSYDGSLVDGKASSSTQKYAADISRANAQLMQYHAQLKNAAIEQYKQTSILPKMSSGLGKVSSGLNSIASKAMPASIAITATFAKGIQAATNFNGKMTEIQALLSDGTPANVLSKQMDTLSDKSKQWARQYGIDTSSINDGMEEMIKRGYDFNQTVGAMPAVLDASRASGEDFGTVMSASTAILEQFGLKTEDTASMMKNTQRVTDSLTFVANKTSAGFEDMGVAMEYVGPVAHSLGMNVEQTAAAVGLLSNNGIEGEKAGTSLRGALSRLLKPTKQSSAAFEELGINIDEWKKGNIGLPDMLDTIKKHTEGMTDAEKSSLVAKAFGVEAQTGMNVLINQGGDALHNLTKETQNATGYTKKLADQMNNSDKNAFNKAKATLEVLSIDLGQKLLPSIIPVVKEIDNLAGSFEKLSPETQQFIIHMALGAAAIAPTAKALSGLTSIISGVTGGLARIGAKGAGELALRGIATEAGGATAAIAGGGGLSASLAGISPILAGLSPVAVGALGVAGLAGLIIVVSKAVDEAKERMKLFGTVNVPQETVSKVENFKSKIDDLTGATTLFETEGTKAFKNVAQAISDLKTTTDSDIDSSTKKLVDEAKNLGFGKDVIDNIKSGGTTAKAVVQQATDEITNIYKNANGEQGKLSFIQQTQVATAQQKIAEQEITALGITGNKKKALMQALAGDINNISAQQAREYEANIQEILNKSNDTFSQKKSQLEDLLNHGKITQEQYTSQEKQIQNEHDATTKAYLSTLENMIMKQGEGLLEGTDQYNTWYNSAKFILEQYGVNIDSLSQKSGTAIDAITATSNSLQIWNSIPDPVKKLLGDNSDFKNHEDEATQLLIAWNLATAPAKKLLAEDLTKNPTMSAQAMINTLTGKSVPLGAIDGTGKGVNSAAATIAALQGKTVGIDANDSGARKTLSGFLGDIPTSKTIDLIINKTNNAQGTPYHPGGLAMVNDQKGPTYKELISLPNGVSFIPEGRDVTMPLPKGTKILKASKTAQLIPKYADGTGGIPANAKIFSDMRAVQQQLVVNAPVADNSSQLNTIIELLKLMSGSNNESLIKAIRALANRPSVSVFDKKDAAKTLTKLISENQEKDTLIQTLIGGHNP
ncbi:phage tail tape measure protein [Lactococcus lactis]|uniref:phage tail tape measure protein n=1 Tax=Lactococcus lactis TaxID=1358 RepID=UPI0010102227|nr:phage tail tape measure protein [Lactococcus lactis]RXS50257.1 phage tail tape measure protein [Lactococcus lactis]